jgi:hypothetical protein
MVDEAIKALEALAPTVAEVLTTFRVKPEGMTLEQWYLTQWGEATPPPEEYVPLVPVRPVSTAPTGTPEILNVPSPSLIEQPAPGTPEYLEFIGKEPTRRTIDVDLVGPEKPSAMERMTAIVYPEVVPTIEPALTPVVGETWVTAPLGGVARDQPVVVPDQPVVGEGGGIGAGILLALIPLFLLGRK